jgi:two-component system sensor histidine kinase QseC
MIGVRAFSLRRRLLTLLLATLAAGWAALVLVTYLDARSEIGEMLDAHLAQSAALLVAQTGHELLEDDEREVQTAEPAHRYERRVAFQIWHDGRDLLLRSASAPALRLSAREEGYSVVELDAQRWRVFSRWDPSRHFLVQVGEREEFRDHLAKELAGNLLGPFWVALPILGVLVWFGVGRGLAPLERMNQELGRRAPDFLEPLDSTGAPTEVRPLVDSLNRLLGRVQATLEQERRFTADAAHELRTPLAALKTQAQVAQGAAEATERGRALDHVIAGCDRAAHLVEQLLTLARLDPERVGERHAQVELRDLAAQVVAELAPLALAKGIDIALAEGPSETVAGDPLMLAVLLRNLVDNAIRYIPAGGEVSVAIERDGRDVHLIVNDDGPGIAPDERARVGQRFYRILGSGETGSGLGLSIVKRIAELHNAAVAVGEGRGGRGLRVSVSFPVLT